MTDDSEYQSTFAAKVWNAAGKYGVFMIRFNKHSTIDQKVASYIDPKGHYWIGNALLGFFLVSGSFMFLGALVIPIFSGFEDGLGMGFWGWVASTCAFSFYAVSMRTFWRYRKWVEMATWNSPFVAAALIGGLFWLNSLNS